MIEGEVSYPIEIQGQNEILIVSLNSVAQSRQKPFAEVEKDIHSIIGKRALAAANIAQLETLQKSYDPNKVNINTLKGKGIACLNNKTSTRAELPLEDKLPPELLSKIFTVQKNNSTSLVSDGKQAYFAYLKTINISNAKSRQIRKNSGEHFSNIIKEGVFQELIGYLGSVASVNRG